jgi:carbamoyl-phosphate synthase large subunit
LRRAAWPGRSSSRQVSADGKAPREVVPPYFSIKEAVFPFNKFPGVDPILGPEMRSTGEVMGVGRTLWRSHAQEPARRRFAPA